MVGDEDRVPALGRVRHRHRGRGDHRLERARCGRGLGLGQPDVQDVIGGEDTTNFDIENYLGTSRVLGFTMLVAVIDVVLLTAIATLGAFLYNMAAALLGGIEVTLAEDER